MKIVLAKEISEIQTKFNQKKLARLQQDIAKHWQVIRLYIYQQIYYVMTRENTHLKKTINHTFSTFENTQ